LRSLPRTSGVTTFTTRDKPVAIALFAKAPLLADSATLSYTRSAVPLPSSLAEYTEIHLGASTCYARTIDVVAAIAQLGYTCDPGARTAIVEPKRDDADLDLSSALRSRVALIESNRIAPGTACEHLGSPPSFFNQDRLIVSSDLYGAVAHAVKLRDAKCEHCGNNVPAERVIAAEARGVEVLHCSSRCRKFASQKELPPVQTDFG
jgi:hypothetical protein